MDGLLKYQDKGEDIERIIRIVNVHSQNLTVTVDGTTRESEFVAEKIALHLLESQKMQPNRETFFRQVAGKQYTCTTTQRLGAPVEEIFAPAFRSLIKDSIEEGVGWKAAVLPTPPNEKKKDNFGVRCACQRVHFKLATFDKTSGDHDSNDFLLEISDKRWLGSDMVSITSTLSMDDHLFLVRELIKSLTGK